MRRRLASMFLILSLLLAGAVTTAHAGLERVGPVSNAPSIGGFPAWYQDKTGLTLEFCDPKNQAEVDGGWCLLLPGDPPAVPEVFPGLFFDEHFWFAADATLAPVNGGNALLVLAVEAAFAAGVEQGGQISFSRIRVRFNNVPMTGTYRFIHPYGEEVLDGIAGDRIFFTDDVGINCPPGTFDCAMASRLGPFLLPSGAPGGAELPPTAGPLGQLYIADPGRSGPVTGSPLEPFVACPSSAPCTLATGGIAKNHNIFRIEGPVGSNIGGPGVNFIETTDFALVGRIFTGAIPGRVTIDRASYTAGPAANKLDVFATAFPTTQGRLPGSALTPVVTPVLSFMDGPCSGTVDPADPTGDPLPPYGAPLPGTFSYEVQMVNAGNNYWGQAPLVTTPALVIPAKVCVEDYTARNAAGQVVPAFYSGMVTDEVSITQAAYNPGAGGTLTVAAASSDAAVPPPLNLSWTGMDSALAIAPVTGAGTFSVTPLAAPPAKVRVVSRAGGINEYQVTTGVKATAPPSTTIPVAVNDEGPTFDTVEETALTISPLANDTISNRLITVADAPIVTITGAPRLGTMGPINPDGSFVYTPNPNASGSEGIAYTVTVGGQVSNIAYITIEITPVNDAPSLPTNDSIQTVINRATTINVLANDTDPDGQADLAAAVIATWPSQLGPNPGTVTGGGVNFTPTSSGTFNFTYRSQDVAGLQSANTATVTVTVAASESITITRSDFVRNNFRWRVEGTDSIRAGQTLTITYDNGCIRNPGQTCIPAAGTEIGTAVVDATGAWALDLTVSGTVKNILNPTNTGGNAISPTFWTTLPTRIRVRSTAPVLGGTTTRTITLR